MIKKTYIYPELKLVKFEANDILNESKCTIVVEDQEDTKYTVKPVPNNNF